MSETKFRAWTGEEMTEPCDLWDRDDSPIQWLNDLPYPDSILMQYTGLHDKNGVEIYEGDILGIPNPAIAGSCYEVIWHDFGWQILLRGREDIKNYYVRAGTHLGDDEVIGNIYENPELLKEKD